MNKYFFSSLRLFHCGKYLVFCNHLNDKVKFKKKEVNERKLIWYIPLKYFEAYFFMMYFSSLNLKQRNENTAVGTHSGPEHASQHPEREKVHVHWLECIPIWQLHRCLVAMETSPSQLCFLYSRPVCDRSRCFLWWCLHLHSTLLPAVRARGGCSGDQCAAGQIGGWERKHTLGKTSQNAIQRARSKTPIIFSQASRENIQIHPFQLELNW